MNDSENALDWISYAYEDFRSASFLFKELYPRPLEIICYHCQQAVEKALKAFLIAKGKSIQKTHDLTFLSQQCEEINPSFANYLDICEVLTPLVVRARYPSKTEISEAEAENALKGAAEIYDFVLAQCQEHTEEEPAECAENAE